MAVRRNLAPQLEEDRKKIQLEIKKILVVAANEAVNFFQDNFRRGGFMDGTLKRWKPRKRNVDPGRGVLIGRGGGEKLFSSISRTGLSAKKVTIGIKGSPQKYASVHNFGLRAGRGRGFTMPKRKFMGESKTLSRKIIRLIEQRVKKIM